jgi:hypothetical protein
MRERDQMQPSITSALIKADRIEHFPYQQTFYAIMSDDEDIAALVIDNGSGMCKGMLQYW